MLDNHGYHNHGPIQGIWYVNHKLLLTKLYADRQAIAYKELS